MSYWRKAERKSDQMTACSTATCELNGFSLYTLENELVRLTLLPEQGADI